jgi:hypothetical protein
MFAETGPNPYDAEALNIAVAAHDLEAGSRKPQIGKVGVFQADVGFIDLAETPTLTPPPIRRGVPTGADAIFRISKNPKIKSLSDFCIFYGRNIERR